MKKALKYIIISAVVLALEALLVRLGKVGFGFGVAFAAAYSLTLNLIKKPVISAIFTFLAVDSACLVMPRQHIGIWGFTVFCAELSVVLVWLTTKYEYGLLLSDALGVLSFYVPLYLLCKYVGQFFVTPNDEYLKLVEYTHYPLMIGCAAGGVIAFLAVPAVRVLARYKEEKAAELTK